MNPSEPELSRRTVVVAGHTGDEKTARQGLLATDAVVRASAVSALDRLDALTETDLATSLHDPDASVRRRAAQIASRYPAVSLLDALADPDPAVVEMAAWSLGEHENPEAAIVAAVANVATGHDDPLAREAAVAALGAIGAEGGLRAILQAMNDKPAIRRRAVIALTPFDGPEVEAALAKARTDRDRQVRRAVEDLVGPEPAETEG